VAFLKTAFAIIFSGAYFESYKKFKGLDFLPGPFLSLSLPSLWMFLRLAPGLATMTRAKYTM